MPSFFKISVWLTLITLPAFANNAWAGCDVHRMHCVRFSDIKSVDSKNGTCVVSLVVPKVLWEARSDMTDPIVKNYTGEFLTISEVVGPCPDLKAASGDTVWGVLAQMCPHGHYDTHTRFHLYSKTFPFPGRTQGCS